MIDPLKPVSFTTFEGTNCQLYYGMNGRDLVRHLQQQVHCIVASPYPYATRPGYDGGVEPWLSSGTRGVLGQEPFPTLYVNHIVEFVHALLFHLHPEGSLWLEVIDSTICGARDYPPSKGSRMTFSQGREGDWLQLPSQIVVALQAANIPVTVIPRIKVDGMPHPGALGPSTSWLLLIHSPNTERSQRFMNPEAIRRRRKTANPSGNRKRAYRQGARSTYGSNVVETTIRDTRGVRQSDFYLSSVADLHDLCQDILNGGYPGLILDSEGQPAQLYCTTKHGTSVSGTWHTQLVETLINFSTSSKGACPLCLYQWRIDKQGVWKQGCDCPPANLVRPRVLDPFAGAGAAGVAARKANCDFIGVEASTDSQLLRSAVQFIHQNQPPRKSRQTAGDMLSDRLFDSLFGGRP